MHYEYILRDITKILLRSISYPGNSGKSTLRLASLSRRICSWRAAFFAIFSLSIAICSSNRRLLKNPVKTNRQTTKRKKKEVMREKPLIRYKESEPHHITQSQSTQARTRQADTRTKQHKTRDHLNLAQLFRKKCGKKATKPTKINLWQRLFRKKQGRVVLRITHKPHINTYLEQTQCLRLIVTLVDQVSSSLPAS